MPKFDPRYNRSSGKPVPEPFHKEDGTALVSKVMAKEHDPGAGQIKFRIGDKNHARTIR
jgi:hypothetical protein